MKTLTEHLTQYADYHRDRRNIVTHFIGIPMIVLALAILLSRPSFAGVTGADVLFGATLIFYWRLSLGFGALMTLIVGACLIAGRAIAALPTDEWLAWGVGLFVVGWAFQFVGHVFERRKPAFVDDIVGLFVGPLFVIAELGFMLGLAPELQREIESRVGPTLIRSA